MRRKSDSMTTAVKKPVEKITGNNGRIVGYACGECGILYTTRGSDTPEEQAHNCCAPYHCKKCQKETRKYYTLCEECSYAARLEVWKAVPSTSWDGSFPIMLWDDDRYFFDEEEFLDFIDDHEGGWDGVEIEACDPVVPRCFEVHDFLQDDLGEDSEVNGDWQAFDKMVNDWIKEHFPKTYIGNGQRITDSVAEYYKEKL